MFEVAHKAQPLEDEIHVVSLLRTISPGYGDLTVGGARVCVVLLRIICLVGKWMWNPLCTWECTRWKRISDWGGATGFALH